MANLGKIYWSFPLIIYSSIRPAKTFLKKGDIASGNDMLYITIKDVSPHWITTSRFLYLYLTQLFLCPRSQWISFCMIENGDIDGKLGNGSSCSRAHFYFWNNLSII
jgi:hypothetical protein